MSKSEKPKLYIVGSHGVPARYGGFETLADFICQNLNGDYDITVFCYSKKYPERNPTYHGVKLKYVNIYASGFKGIIYDLVTFPMACVKADIILFLGPAGAGFIVPLAKLFRTKVIVNHGGLNEWEREKLSWFQKQWAKFNHRIAARRSTFNIADNEHYRDSLQQNFNASAEVIRYGGDHAQKVPTDRFIEKYPFLSKPYAASVSRAQVDNNLHLILEAFEQFEGYPLVLVSNWNVSQYGKDLKEKYQRHANMILLDAIYDQEELNCIRGNAHVYIHTHSRCGTAPSLVEAMCLDQAVLSYKADTNIETTEGKALYFEDSIELVELLNTISEDELEKLAQKMSEIARTKYTWATIAEQYRRLIKKALS